MLDIKVFQVGGYVRDSFLGLNAKDVDYSIEAPSYNDMKNFILTSGGIIFLETPEFFTIRAKMPPPLGCADYVLCRKDGKYFDGRYPSSVSSGTIYDDLQRRDFTINSIAINYNTKEIIDPYNGRQDIKDKIIRCVGNPNDRFNEDRLRCFRAIRFSVTKNFEIEEETKKAIKNCACNFQKVSTERIREELLKMFQVNSVESFVHLYVNFPNLGHVVCERGIWFKPTVEKI